MIYLIGGSPRSGKSTLSRKLSKKLNVPHVSTDNLRLVVLPYFQRKDQNKNFPFIKMLNSNDVDKFFQHYSGQEILKADLKEAETIWPGTKSLIDHLLVCEMDYIIEGVHLLPNFLKRYKGNKNVKIAFLVKLHEEKIFTGLLKHPHHGDWLNDSVKDDNTFSLAAKALCRYGKYFSDESKKNGFRCINTEDNFSDKIEKTCNNLANLGE